MRLTVLAVLVLAACAGGADVGSSGSTTTTAVTADATTTTATGTGPPAATNAAETSPTAAETSGPPTTSTDASTADTSPTDTSTSVAVPARQPEGFETTLASVTTADGTTCEICVWLADTTTQRARGLMFVTDLGPADAMAFRYPAPHTGTFWMKDTVMPLSIAFFSPAGEFLTSFDMEPCTTESCPNYRTAENFLVAVEVPEGNLDELGMGPDSTFELLDLPCGA